VIGGKGFQSTKILFEENKIILTHKEGKTVSLYFKQRDMNLIIQVSERLHEKSQEEGYPYSKTDLGEALVKLARLLTYRIEEGE
jgi:hypothetical protein